MFSSFDFSNNHCPIWSLNHRSFSPQDVADAAHFCAVNETASEIRFANYRSYVSGQLTAFIKGKNLHGYNIVNFEMNLPVYFGNSQDFSKYRY